MNDCGTDGTIEIVERLRREHPRGDSIRILHNEKNFGVSYSRNRIIDEARGHYLYYDLEMNSFYIVCYAFEAPKAHHPIFL